MSKKKRTKKQSKKIKQPKKLMFNTILIVCLLIIAIFIIFKFTETQNIKDQKQETINKQLLMKKQREEEKKLQEEQFKYFEEKTKAMEIEYIEDKEEVIISKPKKNKYFKYIEEKKVVKKTKKIIKKQKQNKHKKPQLAIIIDDVTSSTQIKRIKNIPYPVTMAFLPPTSRHKKSAKIAKNISTYMIHLPLEAGSRRWEEENTLHIEDSFKIIEKRIHYLKKLYPKAKYINNHTGSKFTQNKRSMNMLLKILKQNHYIFVDSRTSSKTVTKKYANKYKLKYLNRNVFLDNKRDKKYIQKQLKKVVRIARKKGYAIAIGHPHKITLKTLAKSKYLLKGLDIVLINKLDI